MTEFSNPQAVTTRCDTNLLPSYYKAHLERGSDASFRSVESSQTTPSRAESLIEHFFHFDQNGITTERDSGTSDVDYVEARKCGVGSYSAGRWISFEATVDPAPRRTSISKKGEHETMRIKRTSVALLFTGMLLLAAPAQAATVDLAWGVSVGNQGTTVINVGDTVRWTWSDSALHSVTSTDGGFTSSSLVSGVGTTYEVTFNSPGAFPYDCSVHSSMQGTISVIAPPAVPLLGPSMLIGLGTLIAGTGLARSRMRKRI
jgi:plastocyanin